MKVKCFKIYNEITKQYQETSYWITIGKEYLVLSVEIRLDRVSFLIQSDHNQQPILQNAHQFEIVSKKIPTNWQIFSGTFELITLEPKEWHQKRFWEDCYNHEQEALELYRKEVNLIKNEEDEFN